MTEPAALVAAARTGDRRALARLLSWIENDRPEAAGVLAELFPDGGRAHVVGMTGAPGAGKSTLTDGLIAQARAGGDEVAVLAVDPSSPYTGGAILGDRIRMQDHVNDRGVYIRSMASRGHLGGVAAATPRALTVLDGVGFPVILVETVGVGQAEVEIAGSADTTVVVVTPGWGDGIQAAKAGLLEIGDVFVVNKGDRPGVDVTVRDLRQMLEMGGERSWQPPVVVTTATSGEGLAELWSAVVEHHRHLAAGGGLAARRAARLEREVEGAIAELVQRRMRAAAAGEEVGGLLADVVARRVDPWAAAERILAGARGGDAAAAP